jgi:hypothetical protein
MSAASLAPANAITIGTGAAHGIQSAVQDDSLIEDVAYVCSHRYYSSGRACWWRPGGYYRGYGYRGYRGYGYRGGYRGYRRW